MISVQGTFQSSGWSAYYETQKVQWVELESIDLKSDPSWRTWLEFPFEKMERLRR